MDTLATFKEIIKIIGPIKTFYVDFHNRQFAYTELKVTSEGKLTNPLVEELKFHLPQVDKCLLEYIPRYHELNNAARKERIYCGKTDEIDEKSAGAVLVQIARKSDYRIKYRTIIHKAIKNYKVHWNNARASQPDPRAPDTLGWRVWHWDPYMKLLISPSEKTVWHTAELRVSAWNTSDVVRGVAGIHAARMPYNWRRASLNGTELDAFKPFQKFEQKFIRHVGTISIPIKSNIVTGIIERFGRYVLGTKGWRAEWVVIRKLKAPSTEIGLLLEQAYPEVEIYYDDC